MLEVFAGTRQRNRLYTKSRMLGVGSRHLLSKFKQVDLDVDLRRRRES